MTRRRKYFRRQTGIIMYYNSKVENCQAFFLNWKKKIGKPAGSGLTNGRGCDMLRLVSRLNEPDTSEDETEAIPNVRNDIEIPDWFLELSTHPHDHNR